MASLDAETIRSLKDGAIRLRINSIEATNASNSGHPTSCSSMADIMSVLFLKVMKYKVKDPRHPSNDRFVLSKGHAAPILYAAWSEVGFIPESDLLNLRKIDSDLEGHPTPRLPFVDIATGSLGQGLSAAAGMAYTGKHWDKAGYRVYCLMGDGESAEGSVWEAMAFASYYQLDNLVAIFDVNRLGQSQPTALQHDLETYKRRVEAFGFATFVVDGHDIASLYEAFVKASETKGRPSAILARTFKGHDFPNIENKENWHGKALGDQARAVIEHLRGSLSASGGSGKKLCPDLPTDDLEPWDLIGRVKLASPPSYSLGQQVAPRLAYGTALTKLRTEGTPTNRVVALDGDVKNSTFSIKLFELDRNRFIECFIAEQNMVGVGLGCAARSRTVAYVSTFAAFFTRAFDQIRMAAVSMSDCNFVGSHAGVSIGEDGPSQMALEDLAMFRSIPGSTVFYPSDAVSTERATELAGNTRGICFIRTGRPNAPVIYGNDEKFIVGKGKVVLTGGAHADKVTVVGAGVTLFEALSAADRLKKEGISIRVIDPFTVKPIDSELLRLAARETGGRVITVEDHYPQGGLGEAVRTALAEEPNVRVRSLAVEEVPRSGKPEELLAKYKIDAVAIVAAVHSIL